MPLVLSVIFWSFGIVAVGAVAILAIYMVLGLLLVQNLRRDDSKYESLQRQICFVTEDAIASSDMILKNTAFLDSSCPVHSQTLQVGIEGARQEPKAIGS